MRLCLAGTFPAEKIVKEYHPEYVLESFFYIRPWQIEEIPKWKMFLLDSGAFTFMHGIEASSKPVDWDGYLSRYIDFINRNNVQHFFELDVDSIVGYDAVKRMRARLEAETGKQSIPVWHRSRGLDEFKRLCRDYHYIGIGGIALTHIQPREYGNIRRVRGSGAWSGGHQKGRSEFRLFQRGQHDMDHTGQFRRAVILQWHRDGRGQTAQGDDRRRLSPPPGVLVERVDKVPEIP